MDRSTPINHLHRSGEQDPAAAEMMDHIVDDLEAEQGMEHFSQRDQQQYERGNEQGPPPQQHRQYPGPQQQQEWHPRGPPPASRGQYGGLENVSFGQRIMSEAKEPLLVSVIVMLMSSNQLNSLIARFLPIASSNPLIGLAVRALAAGVLFYLLRRFIPSA